MRLAHFYHFYASGEWYGPAHDHLSAIWESGIAAEELHVGFIGSKSQVAEAERFITRRLAPRALVKVAEAEEGHEQVTLSVMHEWAKEQPEDVPVLYMHTKGSYTVDPVNDRWRRSMTDELVLKWPWRLEELRTHDMVGSYWVTPEDDFSPAALRGPCFAGNFWWANAGFIASLPPVGNADRLDAEQWTGQGKPNVLSLHHEWPDFTAY